MKQTMPLMPTTPPIAMFTPSENNAPKTMRTIPQIRKFSLRFFISSTHCFARASATFETDSVGSAHSPILTLQLEVPRIRHFQHIFLRQQLGRQPQSKRRNHPLLDLVALPLFRIPQPACFFCYPTRFSIGLSPCSMPLLLFGRMHLTDTML